jgi:hypothetical protein
VDERNRILWVCEKRYRLRNEFVNWQEGLILKEIPSFKKDGISNFLKWIPAGVYPTLACPDPSGMRGGNDKKFYFTSSNSTSNNSVAPGGIAGGAPL